jgi:adenylate kinase
VAVNVIMLGPPGAGKGTQAERVASTRGIPRISTGDILRDAVHHHTAMGESVQAVMDRGELVSDDVMIGIVTERLGRPDVAPGFVLDGFPRTVAQAVALDRLMAERDPLIVLDIVVPESELARRLGTRMICGDCGTNADGHEAVPGRCGKCGGPLIQRADDSNGVVLERFKIYQRATKPLVEFYRERSTFRSINGAQAADSVTADLAAAIEAVGNGRLNAAGGGNTR